MTGRAARRIRVLVVLAALAGADRAGATWSREAWAGPATPGLRAEPAVEVVEAAVNGSASGEILLHNDTAATIAVGSITAEPGCDTAAVHAAPLTGFMLAAGETRAIAITCTPAPASMQRCDYRVRSPSDAVLLELEAVCAYAGVTGLSPDLTAVDFGFVPIGGQASRTIALRNTGAASLNKLFVETTDLGGNFAVAAPCNPDARECDAAIAVVPPGGSTNAVVTCTPRALGLQSAQLHLATSAGTRLAAPISLTCTGAGATAPVISVVPSSIDLGGVELVNATASATVHVTNAGAGTLRLVDIQIVDDGAGAAPDWTYAARAPCEPGIPPTCLLTAGQTPGETIDIDVTFDPRSIGVRDATLLINYRDTADRSISIPLHAIGRGPTLDLVGGQTILDFGTLPLGSAAALTFQVANRGTRILTDGALTVTSPGSPFTVTPGPAFTVGTSAPTTFTVTCRPTAEGAFTATLHLTASDVQGPPIDVTATCAGDAAIALTATPPAILLGEVRLGTPIVRQVAIASAAPVPLAAALDVATPSMTVRGTPATTPATLELMVSPLVEGNLANHLVVTPSPGMPNAGPPLAIAVTGTAVTAKFSAPGLVSLGTFCVEQPTTRRIIQLTSTGTATIVSAAAPALQRSDSPFDLQLIAPLSYPATLPPLGRAIVAVTPRRTATAGLATDDLVWTTDVPNATARTQLTATFVDNGGAIAPDALFFGSTAIHLDARNAQQVTLQNCDVSPLQLDAPQIGAPFSIDSPPPPNLLRPGQTVTFSVGFHPTKLGDFAKTLVITSPQLKTTLTVALTGTGTAGGDENGGGVTTDGLDRTSFYACGSCASGGTTGTIAIALAALCLLRPRRRRPPR